MDTLKVNCIFFLQQTLQSRAPEPNGCIVQTRGTGIEESTRIFPLGLQREKGTLISSTPPVCVRTHARIHTHAHTLLNEKERELFFF